MVVLHSVSVTVVQNFLQKAEVDYGTVEKKCSKRGGAGGEERSSRRGAGGEEPEERSSRRGAVREKEYERSRRGGAGGSGGEAQEGRR